MSGLAPLDFERVDASTTVVTADGATARALRKALGGLQRAAGVRVHETPDTLPLAAWCLRARSMLRARSSVALAPLLGVPAAAELWRQAVADDAGDRLLAPSVAARSAAAAHQLMADYLVDADDPALLATESSRAFSRWRGAYLARCETLGRADPASVTGELLASAAAVASESRPRLVVLGARPWRPAPDALFDALADAGLDVRFAVWRAPRTSIALKAYKAPTPAEEEDAVASWCAGVLAEHGGAAQVAVVVTGIGERAASLDDALAERLPPNADGSAAYSIDHGGALGNEALVRDALASLASLGGELSLDDAAQLLLSPYFAEPDAGPDAPPAEGDSAREPGRVAEVRAVLHAALLAELEDSGEREFSLARLGAQATRVARRIAATPAATRWVLRLTTRTDLPARGERHPAREWTGRFASALVALGWPLGRPLDLGEQRTERAFDDLLDSFAALGDVLPPMNVTAALDQLQTLAMAAPAPSPSVSAPVSVLTPEAAVDRPWSHVWMLGMTEAVWPANVTPNPFLPHSLQKAAGMPGAVAEATRTDTLAMTEALFASATESVTFSHAELDGDSEQGPSPRLAVGPQMPEQVAVPDAAMSLFEQVQAAAPALERFADWHAPSLPLDAVAAGGSGMLADQAACPFRAFARSRLRADAVTRRDSALDALLRGNLLHDTLKDVWEELRDSEGLAATDDGALEALVARHADVHLARAAAAAPSVLKPALLRLERVRLLSLLMEWLGIERERAPFALYAAEQDQTEALGGLRYRLRVDRIDRTGDGLLVIDYKSGAPGALGGWLGERPLSPQLPLYGLLLEEPPVGLAFGYLRRGSQGFRGWGDGDALPPGMVDPREDKAAEKAGEVRDWADWRERWRSRLERLGEEHREGVAVARPATAQVCQQCDKQPLCRIADAAPAGAEAADAGPGDVAVIIDGSDR